MITKTRAGCKDEKQSRNGVCLTVGQLAEHKQLPVRFLKVVGLHDTSRGVSVPFYDSTGEEIVVKTRTALVAKEGSRWPTGVPLAAYGQWKLDEATKAGFLIVVEGESDCWALWHHGLPALGLPGANTAGCLTAEQVEAVETVYVHREPDKGGEEFVKGVAARLKVIGYRGKAFELRMPEGVKDPADLHVKDPAKFLETIKTCTLGATPLGPGGDGFARDRTGEDAQSGGASPSPWEPPLPLDQVPEAPTFPLTVFPERLKRFAESSAFSMNCPTDYVAVPMLVLAGASIGAARCLEIKPGWSELPGLYAAVVAPPGSVKSNALKLVARPVCDEQSRLHQIYLRERQAAEDGVEGVRPREKVIFVADVTTEKLAQVLEDNPRGVVLVRDELTAWTRSMDQYKGGKGADRQFFLSAWSSEPVSVQRKNPQSPSVFVARPFLGVVGGLPPDLLPTLRGSREVCDGFLDRILLSYPAPLPAKAEDWRCVDDGHLREWADTLKWLRNLGPQKAEDGNERPRSVCLTSCGREEWVRFTTRLADAMNKGDLTDNLKGVWSKHRGYCARLALILHCLRLSAGEADGEVVDGTSVALAAKTIDYFQGMAIKVHAMIDSDPRLADAKRVLKWLRFKYGGSSQNSQFPQNPTDEDDSVETVNSVNHPHTYETVSQRDIHSGVLGGRFTPEEAAGVVSILVRYGYLRPVPPVTRSGPGRSASPRYEVHPSLLTD
jgi:hypothetical protein